MESILDKLKVKPNPRKKEDISVKLHKATDELQEIDLSNLLERNPDFMLYDKTKQQNDFEPTQFILEINEKRGIKQNIPKQTIPNKNNKSNKNVTPEAIPTKPTPKPRPKPNVDISQPAIHEIASFELKEEIKQKLPKQKDIVLIKKPSYYMNNREYFLTFVNSLFFDYRKQIINTQTKVECDKKNKNVVTKKKRWYFGK